MAVTPRAVALTANTLVNVKQAGEEAVAIYCDAPCFIVPTGATDTTNGFPVIPGGQGVSIDNLGVDDDVNVISPTSQTIRVLGVS